MQRKKKLLQEQPNRNDKRKTRTLALIIYVLLYSSNIQRERSVWEGRTQVECLNIRLQNSEGVLDLRVGVIKRRLKFYEDEATREGPCAKQYSNGRRMVISTKKTRTYKPRLYSSRAGPPVESSRREKPCNASERRYQKRTDQKNQQAC